MFKTITLSGLSLLFFVSVLSAAEAPQRLFTGGASHYFSDPASWDAPLEEKNMVLISAKATTEDKPAIIDKDFKTRLSFIRVHSSGKHGFGMSYLELGENATLACLGLFVGNSINPAFKGSMVLRKGSSLKPTYSNSGEVQIGGDETKTFGQLTVDAGVKLFSHTRLALLKTGKLIFVFGPDGVTPFTPTLTAGPSLRT